MENLQLNTSKKKAQSKIAILFIVLSAVSLGYLVTLQSYSVQNLVGRDTVSNVFQEIRILTQKNKSLHEEIEELEGTLDQYSHRSSYLQAVNDEIDRYALIAGTVPVQGPGVIIEVAAESVNGIWFVDIVNELLNSSAEAVSVNDIRLVENTVGFDTLPNGQIMVNGSPLHGPFVFKAIGEKEVLLKAMAQPGGALDRFNKDNPEARVRIEEREIIEMDKVL